MQAHSRPAYCQILGLHPPKALHIKAAEQVTGVICHITYMSRPCVEHAQQVGKIWGKLCQSVNYYTSTDSTASPRYVL